MKLKLTIMLLSVIMVVFLLGSCGCKHEWIEADCTTPKTCSLCSETEGEAVGHKWLEATCTAPKTCRNCDVTEGVALGHDWVEATTEAPTTCSLCKVTEGSKIETDPRFTTESTKELYGKWTCDVVLTGEMLGMDGYINELPVTLSYEFKNAGDLIADIKLHDYFAFLDAVKAQTKDIIVYTFVYQGYAESQVDELMLNTYGMTVSEYVDSTVDSIDLDEIFGAFTQDMVYYVGQNGIYVSDSWIGEFEFSEFTITDDVLVITEDVLEEGGEPFQWKRVAE